MKIIYTNLCAMILWICYFYLSFNHSNCYSYDHPTPVVSGNKCTPTHDTFIQIHIHTHYKNAHNHKHTQKNGFTHVKTSNVYVSMCSDRKPSMYCNQTFVCKCVWFRHMQLYIFVCAVMYMRCVYLPVSVDVLIIIIIVIVWVTIIILKVCKCESLYNNIEKVHILSLR